MADYVQIDNCRFRVQIVAHIIGRRDVRAHAAALGIGVDGFPHILNVRADMHLAAFDPGLLVRRADGHGGAQFDRNPRIHIGRCA